MPDLPAPIAAYFAADAKDGDAIAQCFTETAVVTDERRTHIGRNAIRQWKADTSAKFSYTVEPISLATEDHKTIVTGRVSGDFPGSPVTLRYIFGLEGDRIAKLEIIP